MTTIEKSVVIKAPLEKVFRFAVDMRNLESYFVYVEEVKSIGQDIIQKGAIYSLKVKFLGRVRPSRWECTEYIDNIGWTFNATLMGLTAVKRWLFEKEDDSTRVTFTLEYNMSPPVIGPLLDFILIKRIWRKLYEQSFSKLKDLMEHDTSIG